MKSNFFKKFTVLFMILAFLGVTILAGCNEGSSKTSKKDAWADYEGQNGSPNDGALNMAEVTEALDRVKSPDDIAKLEEEVNEIYEGDEMILIKVEKSDDGRKELSGWADMNADSKVGPEDDKLFSRLYGKKDGKDSVEDRGHGVNSHYRRSHLGEMMFYAWLFSPSYHYYTPYSRVSVMRTTRTTYRSSSHYSTQKTRNASYQKKAQKANPSAYKNAKKNTSPTRKVAMDKSRKDFAKRDANKAKSSGKGFMGNKTKSASKSGKGFMNKSSGSKVKSSARSTKSSSRSKGK